MKRIAVVVVVAACGSSSSKTPDAHGVDGAHGDAAADSSAIDATADASPDAMLDAPAMGSGAHYHYVINSITWPETSNDARALAFDLDGNGTLDNQLGMVTATMRSQGFDLQTPQDQEIARGAVLVLADLQATDLTTATGAGFTTYAGENPNPPACNGSADTVCGHHLTGTASFDVAATPREAPLLGAITSGQYTGGPGKLPMELSIVTSTPVSTTLLGAHAKLTATANGIMQGVIGGAIPSTDFDTKVYPAMATSFQAIVARDCSQLGNPPQCGCMASSTGAELISLFDTTPSNCTISTDEVKNNSLIQALFMPDVTINGQMALSAGFGFTAVDATFTP